MKRSSLKGTRTRIFSRNGDYFLNKQFTKAIQNDKLCGIFMIPTVKPPMISLTKFTRTLYCGSHCNIGIKVYNELQILCDTLEHLQANIFPSFPRILSTLASGSSPNSSSNAAQN